MSLHANRIWSPMAAFIVAVAFVVPTTLLPIIATADFLTPQAPAITLDPGVPASSSVLAIISSGETIDGFTFQGIPDGI